MSLQNKTTPPFAFYYPTILLLVIVASSLPPTDSTGRRPQHCRKQNKLKTDITRATIASKLVIAVLAPSRGNAVVVQHGRRWPRRRQSHAANRIEWVQVELGLIRDRGRVSRVDHGLLVARDGDWWRAALALRDAVEVGRGQDQRSADNKSGSLTLNNICPPTAGGYCYSGPRMLWEAFVYHAQNASLGPPSSD